MVRSSGQQKFALVFCGVCLLVLGSGITASGFIVEFLDPYDNTLLFITHIQYWLGIPLFLLGIFVLATTCFKVKYLLVFGFVAASLMLVTSICGVILEGPTWRDWLKIAMLKNKAEECEDVNAGGCSCSRPYVSFNINPSLTCDEVDYVTIIRTVMVVFSALAIVVCQFCCFVYCRILGWMLHIRYEDPVDDYYAKAFANPHNNGHHARANQVVLDRMG